MKDVRLVASWVGWCSPCAVERPLVLTEYGPRGLLVWLRGAAAEDRDLRLTCRICGQWQHVPQDEADDLEGLGLEALLFEPDDLSSAGLGAPGLGAPGLGSADLGAAGLVTAGPVAGEQPSADRHDADLTEDEDAVPFLVTATDREALAPLLAPVAVQPLVPAPAVAGEQDVPAAPSLVPAPLVAPLVATADEVPAVPPLVPPSAAPLVSTFEVSDVSAQQVPAVPLPVPAPPVVPTYDGLALPVTVPTYDGPAAPSLVPAAPVVPAYEAAAVAPLVPALAPPLAPPAVPAPRVAPVAPEGADLATVLELLSQGLEMSGAAPLDRAPRS